MERVGADVAHRRLQRIGLSRAFLLALAATPAAGATTTAATAEAATAWPTEATSEAAAPRLLNKASIEGLLKWIRNRSAFGIELRIVLALRPAVIAAIALAVRW